MNAGTVMEQSATLRQIASDAPNYERYLPLTSSSSEIRVLDLKSESVCTLRHVSLDDAPEYFALSYYWGPPTSTKPLTIRQADSNDSQVVEIRRTVAAFLKQLYRRHGVITIWLDVICINQRSIEEQSSQVAMMGEIYRRAQGVYAWMGGWDPDIEYIFEQCNRATSIKRIDISGNAKLVAAADVLSLRPYWTR
jgi:hypothetical protein